MPEKYDWSSGAVTTPAKLPSGLFSRDPVADPRRAIWRGDVEADVVAIAVDRELGHVADAGPPRHHARMQLEIAGGVRPGDCAQHGRALLQVTHRLPRDLGRLRVMTWIVLPDQLGLTQRAVDRLEGPRRVLCQHFGKAARRRLGVPDGGAISAVQIEKERRHDRGNDQRADHGHGAIRAIDQFADKRPHRRPWILTPPLQRHCLGGLPLEAWIDPARGQFPPADDRDK
jgi:hypothetical protein